MAKVERWVCDKCGQTSNGLGMDGWVVVATIKGESTLLVRPLARPAPAFQVVDQHFCGMQCAMSSIQDALRAIMPSADA